MSAPCHAHLLRRGHGAAVADAAAPQCACAPSRPRSLSHFSKDTKLIYRHYATLYFVFAVDAAESELGILDLIQVLVEVLDKCFEAVCELDLIFHPDKVHFIVDEVVMGGMVLETNIGEVLEAITEMSKLEAATRTASIKA